MNDLDYGALAATITPLHDSAIFMVSEEAAAAIRTAYDQGGELRHFTGILDTTVPLAADRPADILRCGAC